MQLTLTQNAIIHMSVGFQGPFVLQAFGISRPQHQLPSKLQMCLTDGILYIGATYTSTELIESLQNYCIVLVTVQFISSTRPINIVSLELISNTPQKLIGKPPCTLYDFLNKQTQDTNYFSEPKKKIKLSDFPLEKISHLPDHNKSIQDHSSEQIKQKSKISETEADLTHSKQIQHKITQPRVRKEKKVKTKVVSSGKKVNGKRQLRFANESQSNESEYENSNESSPLMDIAEQESPKERMNELNKNCLIKDLFERHSGWVILCRVNFLSIVECSHNKNFAINFILVDQLGYQIKCVYFANDFQTAKAIFILGGYYLLAGGEIKSKDKELQITFDRTSTIERDKHIQFNVNPNKITRIQKISDQDHGQEINVLGVIKKIKNKQSFRSKTKFTATLCDPLRKQEIDFLLFLNHTEKQIEVGMVVVLHNFQVYKQMNITRLNSTFRSYYFQQKSSSNQNNIVQQFITATSSLSWSQEYYRNVSLFLFSLRTISQLKELSKAVEDQKLYTAIDCRILDISIKKTYLACSKCKRAAQKKQMGLFECGHCKKMVDILLTYTLSVNFTDWTGSCYIDVIGEHAENILEKSSSQFNELNSDQQSRHLEQLRYKNVYLKLKSERKEGKRQQHSVWGISKASAAMIVKEINRNLNTG